MEDEWKKDKEKQHVGKDVSIIPITRATLPAFVPSLGKNAKWKKTRNVCVCACACERDLK